MYGKTWKNYIYIWKGVSFDPSLNGDVYSATVGMTWHDKSHGFSRQNSGGTSKQSVDWLAPMDSQFDQRIAYLPTFTLQNDPKIVDIYDSHG